MLGSTHALPVSDLISTFSTAHCVWPLAALRFVAVLSRALQSGAASSSEQWISSPAGDAQSAAQQHLHLLPQEARPRAVVCGVPLSGVPPRYSTSVPGADGLANQDK